MTDLPSHIANTCIFSHYLQDPARKYRCDIKPLKAAKMHTIYTQAVQDTQLWVECKAGKSLKTPIS